MTVEKLTRAPRMPAALALSALLLSASCQTRAPQEPRRADAGPAATPAKAATPEVNILVDEPRLAKPFAVIGGTVQNLGRRPLSGLSVQIELRRRADDAVERRDVAVEPSELAPGGQGKFILKVKSEEWRSSTVVGLRGGEPAREVAFKTMPGAKRPPERIPDRVVEVKTPRPKPKSGSDEFINTPDTPIKVP